MKVGGRKYEVLSRGRIEASWCDLEIRNGKGSVVCKVEGLLERVGDTITVREVQIPQHVHDADADAGGQLDAMGRTAGDYAAPSGFVPGRFETTCEIRGSFSKLIDAAAPAGYAYAPGRWKDLFGDDAEVVKDLATIERPASVAASNTERAKGPDMNHRLTQPQYEALNGANIDRVSPVPGFARATAVPVEEVHGCGDMRLKFWQIIAPGIEGLIGVVTREGRVCSVVEIDTNGDVFARRHVDRDGFDAGNMLIGRMRQTLHLAGTDRIHKTLEPLTRLLPKRPDLRVTHCPTIGSQLWSALVEVHILLIERLLLLAVGNHGPLDVASSAGAILNTIGRAEIVFEGDNWKARAAWAESTVQATMVVDLVLACHFDVLRLTRNGFVETYAPKTGLVSHGPCVGSEWHTVRSIGQAGPIKLTPAKPAVTRYPVRSWSTGGEHLAFPLEDGVQSGAPKPEPSPGQRWSAPACALAKWGDSTLMREVVIIDTVEPDVFVVRRDDGVRGLMRRLDVLDACTFVDGPVGLESEHERRARELRIDVEERRAPGVTRDAYVRGYTGRHEREAQVAPLLRVGATSLRTQAALCGNGEVATWALASGQRASALPLMREVP